MIDRELGELDGDDPQRRAEQGLTAGRASRIAWHRARGLSMVSRVPVLGAVVAPWLWPMHLAVVSGQSGQIRYRNTASMTVSDGGRNPIQLSVLTLAAAALLTEFIVLVMAGTAASILLLPFMSPVAASATALLVLLSPLVLEGPVRAMIRLARDRESLTMNRRRRELGEHGPTYLMSSFVRSSTEAAAGEGRALLDAMKNEWQAQHAAVILYPANDALARYYSSAGAQLIPGARHLMQFNYHSPDPRLHAHSLAMASELIAFRTLRFVV